MRRMAVQFRREFAAYFMTPMGFVIMTILLVLTGLIFSAALVQYRMASFQLVVPTLTFVNFIIAPVVSMRLIAEERRTGTLESLMTAPVREWEIIVAKYLGAVCFYMVLYLPTLFYLGLLFYYSPTPRIENGPEIPQAASAYLALFLSGAAFISVGLLVSTLTRHQIVAAVLGVIGCIILWILGIAGAWVGGVVGAMLEYLGTFDHLDAFSRGIISTRDGIYFLSVIGLFLFLSQVSLTRRSLPSTIIACALSLLIFAEVNYLGNRHYLRMDITASQRYSLSPKSIQIVQSLDVPIRVSTTFTMRDDSMTQTLELLGEYAQYSDNFLFRGAENINPPEDPEAFQAHAMRYKFYNYEEAVDHIVLDYRGGERTRVVRIRDLLEQTPTGMAYLGEEKITGALLDLTEARKTGVYFTVGHGERSTETPGLIGLSKWRRYLEVENYRVEEIDLAQEAIPEDCDCIVVAGPSDPFRPEEEDALRGYLSGGGRALLMIGSESRPGLKGLLDEWGVDLRDDRVLSKGPFGLTGQVLVTRYTPHPITAPLEEKRVALDYARSVDTVRPLPEGIQGEVLFESHEEAWSETVRKGRIEGPIPLAVALEKGDARLIVVGSVAFGENGNPLMKIGIDDGANNDLALNTVGHLTERQRVVGIAPKKVDIRRVELDEGDETVIYLLCLGFLPGLCLLAGLAIWWSRRG